MAADNNESLAYLLEQDREQVFSSLQAERASDRARQVLEKETDRLMYRAAQMTQDGSRSQAVQGMLQVVRNTLPFLESVTETEIWEKNASLEDTKKVHITIPGIISLIAGVVCVAAGLLGQSAAGKILRPGALLWSAAGCALLVLGGYLAGHGKRSGGRKQAPVKQTFLIDPAQVWHVLQGIALTADHSLDEAEEYAKLEMASGNKDARSVLNKEEMTFFAELLENAYARRRSDPEDEALREQVESIRYYLHTRGVETADYTQQDAEWFELLPSGGKSATIRPAMLSDGVLIRKGLATR